MLVGMPFSGKTTALNCLQKTLTDLANEGIMHAGCAVHQAGGFWADPQNVYLQKFHTTATSILAST